MASDTRATAQIGRRLVTGELRERGFTVRQIEEGRRSFLAAENNGRLRLVRVTARRAGTWQTSISSGARTASLELRDRMWIFVGILSEDPAFFVVPEAWMAEEIFSTHQEYLRRHDGTRPQTPRSKHHSVSLSCIGQMAREVGPTRRRVHRVTDRRHLGDLVAVVMVNDNGNEDHRAYAGWHATVAVTEAATNASELTLSWVGESVRVATAGDGRGFAAIIRSRPGGLFYGIARPPEQDELDEWAGDPPTAREVPQATPSLEHALAAPRGASKRNVPPNARAPVHLRTERHGRKSCLDSPPRVGHCAASPRHNVSALRRTHEAAERDAGAERRADLLASCYDGQSLRETAAELIGPCAA